jgi:putative DNA primase/helicase
MSDSFDNAFNGEVNTPAPGPGTNQPLHRLMNIVANDSEIKGMFCFNTFTGRTEHAQDNYILLAPTAKKSSPVMDTDMVLLKMYVSAKYHLSLPVGTFWEVIINEAMKRQVHPPRNYLEKLVWDKTPRLEKWLTQICGAPDDAYVRAVSRKLFVAIVKRIYEPGCYFAQLPILEGAQRIGKSRLVKAIGGDWYASINLQTHDTRQVIEDMYGKLVLEIEELAGFGKQDVEFMKAFISRTTDRARLSYARVAGDYPRQSVMIATMNPDAGGNKYLNDNTGNVRYWPIACSGKIHVDAFLDVRDQLFAEAIEFYKQGESLWLNEESENQMAVIEQQERLVSDPWEEIIGKWLEDKAKLYSNQEITTAHIAMVCLEIPKERVHPSVKIRIGRVMARLGWTKRRQNSGNREWYYLPPSAEPQEWTE